MLVKSDPDREVPERWAPIQIKPLRRKRGIRDLLRFLRMNRFCAVMQTGEGDGAGAVLWLTNTGAEFTIYV